jgi:hypothetical protein
MPLDFMSKIRERSKDDAAPSVDKKVLPILD